MPVKQTLKIRMQDSSIVPIMCHCYYVDEQNDLYVIATEKDSINMHGDNNVEYKHLGRFENQQPVYQAQLWGALGGNNWPFLKYPNPEIILANYLHR